METPLIEDPGWWRDRRRQEALREVRLSVLVPVYNERFLVGELLRRLLAVSIPGVAEIEVLVVDDASTDGSAEIVEELAAEHPGRLKLIRKEVNEGKGSALRLGIAAATGDLIVVQDADLEYDPRELAKLVQPFRDHGADVVYGSRFAAGAARRVLHFRHSLGNRFLTFLSNLFTDLNLSDVETGYKMFRAPLLKSIPLRSNGFGVEVELTAKVAKRRCQLFEVPISYRGRTYREGKKITWWDGFRTVGTIARFWLVDDLYREDQYGGQILHRLERAHRFNGWLAATLEPAIGARVLEIGAGIGNITQWMVPRDLYVASDINPDYLHYLRNFGVGKPYLEVARIDIEEAADFDAHEERFDTVLCSNVLEHVREPVAALLNLRRALMPGGRLVLYVPRGPRLQSTLDEAIGHRRRYDRGGLTRDLEQAGLEVESMSYFNRAAVPGWWWNGKLMKRRQFSRWQLKIFDHLVPLLRRTDRLLPWKGLGIITVARRV